MSAEHSTYFTALRSLASFSAVSGVMGFCLFLASFSMVDGSSRKSIWVPTSRNGVFGQWWVISGTHCSQADYKQLFNTNANCCNSCNIRCNNLRQKSPFLWHFQRKTGRQQRNRPGTHLSADNSTAVTCRNLPDLKKAQIELANWSTAGKCEWPTFRGDRRWYVHVGGKAYLLYQTDPECRALLRSSQSRHSYQTPETDTHSVISAAMISAAMTQSSSTCPQTHRRNIFRGKLVCGVRDEQAGFTHSTVTNDNTLDGLHGCVSHSSLLIQYLQQKSDTKGSMSQDVESPRLSNDHRWSFVPYTCVLYSDRTMFQAW